MERKHSFRNVAMLGVMVLILATPVPAQYSGGAGSADDPYQIATAQDLIDLGNTPNDYDKHFVLTADIDLAETPFDRAVIPSGSTRTRGASNTPFGGVFAGNKHVIRHLQIIGQGDAGLFRYIAKGAVISDLGLEDVTIEASGSTVGALVGHNGGVLLNCSSTGTVAGEYSTGGLVGYNSGTLSNCYSTCATTGSESVGGLVGYNTGDISRCYSTGGVTGNDSVGGLVGDNPGSITSCYSTGLVVGDDNFGGLVAHNSGSVASCFWDVETSGVADGIAGMGLTTAEMQNMETYLEAGWDFVAESANGTAEAWQMPEASGYPRLSVFEGYEPVLPPGQGTPGDPFLIADAQELGAIGARPRAAYRLDADINLADITWTGAVVPWFAGDFEGDGHVIRHLHVQGAGFLGLFGSLDPNGAIGNLSLEDAAVQGSGSSVGALAGYSEAAIVNCHGGGTVAGYDRVGLLVGYNLGHVSSCSSTGTVDGHDNIGGLVGFNHSGYVSRCYSSSAVTGNRRLGGLVGGNSYGTVSHCYSVGTVAGYDDVGGLVGNNDHASSVSQCYSIGVVSGAGDVGGLLGYSSGRVRRSCWDVDSSGTRNSADGAGLTTAEMMDPEWIGLQGWANDPNWVLDAFQDYPRLAWEGTAGQMVPEPVTDWIPGEGTEDAPYELSAASQVLTISKASLLWEKAIVQTNDLDLTGIAWPRAVFPSFSGTLDGNGHTISHLNITGRNYLGLVGRLEDGIILDLTLSDVHIVGSDTDIGGLVGYIDGGSVQNCQSSGAVAGGGYVGGLVGENVGSVKNCRSTARVTGNDLLGGLVGVNHRGVSDSSSAGAVTGQADYVGGLFGWNTAHVAVSNCFSTGAVTGRDGVGGLIGWNFASAPVSNCFSTGCVAGRDNVAGLVGYNRKNISQCFSTGTVTGNNSVGGLVGHNHTNAIVSDCYSTGQTQGRAQIGGLVGSDSRGDILNCYSTGRVVGNEDIGGLVGNVHWTSEVDDSFWDVTRSGRTASAGGLGLTTGTMQQFSTYRIAGWDITDETAEATTSIWWIDDGRDYPRLSWEESESRE